MEIFWTLLYKIELLFILFFNKIKYGAVVILELIKLSDSLDKLGMKKEANLLDGMIKMAAESGDKRIAIRNDLSFPVQFKPINFARYITITTGNMIIANDGESIIIRWKDPSSGSEQDLTIGWDKISSSPRSDGMVKVSDLSDKFSSFKIRLEIDESHRGKTLSDKAGYTYVISGDGNSLTYSKGGVAGKRLDRTYPKWLQVVQNINRLPVK